MKKVLVVVFALALVSTAAINVSAQTPNVQAYFDAAGSLAAIDCPSGMVGSVATVVIIANNFNMFLTAIEFAVDYSPALTYVADISTATLKIGTSPAGVALAWPIPQNAFAPLVVLTPLVTWNCDGCGAPPGAALNTPVRILPHPGFGLVRAVRWPDGAVIIGVGMTSLICPSPPVSTEKATWGKVKALYDSN